MSAFKPGDKVLLTATVKEAWPGDELIFVAVGGTLPTGGVPMYVNADAVQPVPEPPYVEPELVPGMVVMSKDEGDDRMWHYLPGGPADAVPFRSTNAYFTRDELPERIRPVFDPREVAS